MVLRKPRVLLLVDSLRMGGAERLTVVLANGLRRRGVDARLAHLGIDGSQILMEELRTADTPELDLHLGSLFDPRSTLRLTAYLRREGIDLLHTHNRYAHLVGRPAAALARRPVLSTIHNIQDPVSSRREWVRRALDYWTARTLCTAIITVSEAQRQVYLRATGIDPTRVETHMSGVDTERFRPDPSVRDRLRTELGVAADTILILTIAMLRPGKGIQDALKAVARLRNQPHEFRFLIAGDGIERSQLERAASALGLENHVQFLGVRGDASALLAAADIYLCPSHFEALSTSVLEAMATGLPVVATEVGGLPEIVTNNQTGLLVPARSPLALATAMERLFDPHIRAAMGNAGRGWVESHASTQTWLDSIVAVYERVVGRSQLSRV
jgi:glycosyltransferase involved in cell wall biosynthesis